VLAGIELSPAVAFVGPLRSQLFQARSSASAAIVGLLVGWRPDARAPWVPAIERVTIELVAIRGVKLGRGLALLPERDGWHVRGGVGIGDTIAVCVRNDHRAPIELRAVLAIDGQGSPGPHRPGRHLAAHRR